jgi:serine/threonine protein kinase
LKFSSLYDLKRILGAGGFGVVCYVRCRETQRNIALKITQWNSQTPSQSAQQLSHEYKMLSSQLNHPNIIKVFQQEQRFSNYFIMEMELGLETLE